MPKRAQWTLRIVAALVASAVIALVLHRHLGFYPTPPRVDVGRLPIVGHRWAGKTVELLWPRVLWLCVLVPVFGLVVGASLADLPPLQRWLGVCVRSLLALALVVALSRPSTASTSSHVATIFWSTSPTACPIRPSPTSAKWSTKPYARVAKTKSASSRLRDVLG